MHYYTPRQMRRLGARIGTASLRPEGFFALNAQPSDLDLLGDTGRLVVRVSGLMVGLARLVPPTTFVADSIYVHATRI